MRLQSKPRSWQAADRLRQAIAHMEPFETYGSLQGINEQAGFGRCGQLEDKARKAFLGHRDGKQGQHMDYVVYSYSTPIAWHVNSQGWFYPDTSYSRTTSAQQTHVRVALDVSSSRGEHVTYLSEDKS